MSFIKELKRRNVIRMAGLYLVGAWLLIQIAETLLPAFEVPGWVLRAVIILLALGFIPALVFSWIFELTPDGLKRDVEITASESVAPQTARRLDRMLLLVMALALGYFAVDKFLLAPGRGVTETPAVAGSAVPPTSHATGASIAVLPFLNLSTDVENGYFADGISEELLNVLAGIDGLKVASRTSSFSFKGKDTPIRAIAQELDVRHILEGSVRKQGQRVRITAQLIDVSNDGHLWSETFDRDLVDIFKVQEEIAQAIAGKLESSLGKNTVSLTASTTNLAAYERFLSGRERLRARHEFAEAIADFDFATQQDPKFAEAWVHLAISHFVRPGYEQVDGSNSELMRPVLESLERARALVPQHPLVLALQGMIHLENGDQDAGLDLLARAADLSERDSTPAMWLGQLLLRAGYVAEATAALERAERLEPKVGINLGSLSMAYLSSGQSEKALAKARQAAELGWTSGEDVYAIHLVASGEREAAAEILAAGFERLPLEQRKDPKVVADFATLTTALRDPTAANIAALKLQEDRPEDLLLFGRGDEFLEHIQEMNLRTNDGYFLRSLWLPSTRRLREDPRFFAYATESGYLRLWETRGFPTGCQRVSSAKGEHLDCSGKQP